MGSNNIFTEFLRSFDRLMQQGGNPGNYEFSIKRQNLSEKMYTNQTDNYGRDHFNNNLNDS